MDETVEFRILGPLEVCCRGVLVPLSGSREQRLLAALLLSANRVVSLPHLVDAVWHDTPPATAKRQVQNCMSALRSRLRSSGALSAVAGGGSGYKVCVDDGQLDAQRFGRLVSEAGGLPPNRDPERARLLRTALALWHGPALAGLSGRVIEAGAARLDEQRLTIHERCLEVELQLGRHEELIGELSELVAVNPLRERLVAQLMLALHRSARQADALQAYHRLGAHLADELGVDPAAELQQLHLAILRKESPPANGRQKVAASVPLNPGHPGVDAPKTQAVPQWLPAVAGPFVGRRRELDMLDRLATSSKDADVAVIATLAGAAGTGKTATAVYWAHRAAAQFPDGQLYVNLCGFDPSGTPKTPAEAIRGFLDAFEVPSERIPASLDAQIGLYRSLLAGRRLLVVLDNARDAPQIRPLLPGAPGCMAVVTSRNQLTSLVAKEGAYSITLDMLSTNEARELLSDRVRAEPHAVAHIITRCAGLPLALVIMAARATARPTLPLSTQARELGDTQSDLDVFDGGDPATDLRAVFSWSYHTLSADAARMFRLLGTHQGPDIATPAAASLAGLPVEQVRKSLEELVCAHMIVEHAPARFALHELMHAYATELAHTHDSNIERRL